MVGFISSIGGGLMAYAQGKSDKAIADYNAAIAEQNAEQARRAAEVSARDTRDATRRQLGSMRAAYGTSGVVTTEGSPLLALVDQAEQGDYEADKALYAGELQARGFNAEAAIQRVMGKQAAKNGRLALYGSIISAGAKAGTMAASGGTSGLALM